jgi:sterol desaturase/sphingolipid hydroxylase (fatty acid hydroxylase superfamily)
LAFFVTDFPGKKFVTLTPSDRHTKNQSFQNMNNIRKVTGYILVSLIVVFTTVAILGIWEIIDLQEVLAKVLTSLLVVFVASAVVLFITTVLLRDETKVE